MSVWCVLFLAVLLINVEVGIRLGVLGEVLGAILRRGDNRPASHL